MRERYLARPVIREVGPMVMIAGKPTGPVVRRPVGFTAELYTDNTTESVRETLTWQGDQA